MRTKDKIKELLKEGKYASQIAKLLHISRSAVSQHIKQMNLTPVKFQTVYKAYELNDKLNSDYIPNIKPSKLSLRLHRFQRNYKLLEKPDKARLSGLKQGISDQWLGNGFRITNNILELEGLEVYTYRTTPVAILEAVALTLANNTANSLAKQYGLVIAQEGYTPPKLTEIELTEHEMAERVEQRGIIPIYKDQEGYMVWMDKSFGLGGLESNKATYIQKLATFTNYIVEDRWSVEKQLELNQKILEGQDFFARNINMHVQWMYESLKAHSEGRRLPKKPKPEDVQQRRL